MPRGSVSEETKEKIRQSLLGRKHSDEVKAKMRVSHSQRPGRKQSAETRAKISAAHQGIKASDETRTKLSVAGANRTHSDETKERIGSAQRGRARGPMSDATKAKLSASLKGVPKTVEHRAKISAAHKDKAGHPVLDATRQKISARLKGREFSDEERRKNSLAHLGKPFPESTKERMRQSWAERVCREGCRCARCWIRPKVYSNTALEIILLTILLSDFPAVIPQQRFGRYAVDAYLPQPYHLAFEADGNYWHSSPKSVAADAKRDATLFAKYGLVVVRLSEAELLRIQRDYDLLQLSPQ